MSDIVKQNDWVSSLIYNQDFRLEDFKEAGISEKNTTIASREDYANNETIKSLFKTEEGKFNDVEFNKFYDNALLSYNKLVFDDLSETSLQEIEITENNKLVNNENTVVKSMDFQINIVGNPTKKASGIRHLFAESDPIFSMAEAAQTQRVYDTKEKKFKDWTPNDDDKRGMFDFLTEIAVDPLVMAQWEEDGIHYNSSGIEEMHYKNDYKLNDKGMPYYETLGKRDTVGKTFLTHFDTLTKEGTLANDFDFFDSDGISKSKTGQVVKLTALALPFFIPVVGEAYGYAMASV